MTIYFQDSLKDKEDFFDIKYRFYFDIKTNPNKIEIRRWLEENTEGLVIIYTRPGFGKNLEIGFEDEQDYIAFKLRW